MRIQRYAILYAPASRMIGRVTPRTRRLYACLEGTLLLALATSIALYVQL